MAGATVDNSIILAPVSTVPGFSDQVETLTLKVEAVLPWHSWAAEDALAAVENGDNNVGNSSPQSGLGRGSTGQDFTLSSKGGTRTSACLTYVVSHETT